MADRPVIGVTGPARRLRLGWWATRFSLFLCGADACYITAVRPRWRRPLDGIIIGGGDDIHPQNYGAQASARARYDPPRDRLEIEIARRALDQRLPVLGICRGAQLLNLVLGGVLHQDIRGLHRRTPFRNSVWPVKRIEIAADSKLRRCLNIERTMVNSLHHQAVDRCGAGLSAVAWDENRIIQGIEADKHEFVVGVQWHPEYLPYRREQRAIFSALVTASRAHPVSLPSAGA